jgi:predicted amidohydrolase
MKSSAPIFTVACLQLNSTNNLWKNIDKVLGLIDRAVANGAMLICMPENVVMMESSSKRSIEKAQYAKHHPAINAFKLSAKQHKIWLHCGSLSIKTPGSRLANRTVVISPEGCVVGEYDKINMFDVDLGNGERYAESATFAPGKKLTLVTLPWGVMGLTICYDIRFPALYRSLAQGGAQMIVVPSAFTVTTGQAHWMVLLRARAIETGCFIFAPAQVGAHSKNRQTFGHSMIIDPWGRVLAEAKDEDNVILAEIDLSLVALARKKIPSFTHDAVYRTP